MPNRKKLAFCRTSSGNVSPGTMAEVKFTRGVPTAWSARPCSRCVRSRWPPFGYRCCSGENWLEIVRFHAGLGVEALGAEDDRADLIIAPDLRAPPTTPRGECGPRLPPTGPKVPAVSVNNLQVQQP